MSNFDIKLALITGVDIPIPECQLILHQPTIKEISMIGEKDFFTGISCLCIDKKQLELEENKNITLSNFDLFMTILQQDKEKKYMVQQVLTLLFPQCSIYIVPQRSIGFNSTDLNSVVDNNNFNFLQNVLKKVFCLHSMGKESFNPQGAQAEEIAKKLLRARQRVAAQRIAEQGESSLGQYVSIITIGIGSMSLQASLELTIYQLYDLIERYNLYKNWDIGVQVMLAGGSGKDKLENWMKPIH